MKDHRAFWMRMEAWRTSSVDRFSFVVLWLLSFRGWQRSPPCAGASKHPLRGEEDEEGVPGAGPSQQVRP